MVNRQSAVTPQWGVSDLRHAIQAAGVALWSWDVETDRITMDAHSFHLWGVGLRRRLPSKTCLRRSIHRIATGCARPSQRRAP